MARLEHAVADDERFPVLLADPPYLRSDDVARFPQDPMTAIDGGADGLAVVRLCLGVTAAHLADGGAAVFQVAGERQAEELAELCASGPLAAVDRRIIDGERALVLLRHA